MSSRLVLDMRNARRTQSDDVAGVVATVGDRSEAVIFTADACMAASSHAEGLACDEACISPHQAWLAVFLLTGRETLTPIGDGQWCQDDRTITFPLRSGRRSTMG